MPRHGRAPSAWVGSDDAERDARFHGTDRRVERLIEGSAEAPAEARSAVSEMDASLGWRSADARLVVSELTTNAWKHGHDRDSRPIRLTVEHRDGGLRMEVEDQGPGFYALDRPDGGGPDQAGWGLRIVRGLSDAWGVRRSPGGTCVWALIRPREAAENLTGD